MPSAVTPSADFQFKTVPFAHQRTAFDKSANFKYAAYFMEQGTGKTKLVIDRSVYLYLNKKIDAVLIICPKSLTETWEEELATHCSLPITTSAEIAVWNPSLTKKVIKEMEKVLYASAEILPFLIMNIEAVRTPKGEKLAHWFARHKRVHVVMDESSKIKTPSAKQTTAAISLAHACACRSIMTGTPVSNSPADYYSQINFLMPNPLGFGNFYSFRARYCVLENKTITFRKPQRTKGGKFKKTRTIVEIKGPKNAEELKRKLLPFSVFVKKKDCLDLPDKIYHKRHCQLTPDGKRLYSSVKQQILTEIEDGRELTVDIQLTKLLRLQQITGGFLPSDDDIKAKAIPGRNPKLELLLELFEQFPGPTIIWARFKAEHVAIRRLLESITTPDKIGEIVGQVKKDIREQNRRAFQSGAQHYLICTQACAGYGYTLTAAENEIYYSNTFSLEHREQSEDRAHRIGQDKHINIVDMLMPDTVDVKVHKALISKRNVADLLTDVSGLEEIV